MGVTYIYSIEKTRYSDSQLPTLLTDGKPAQSGRNPPSFFLPPKRKIQWEVRGRCDRCMNEVMGRDQPSPTFTTQGWPEEGDELTFSPSQHQQINDYPSPYRNSNEMNRRSCPVQLVCRVWCGVQIVSLRAYVISLWRGKVRSWTGPIPSHYLCFGIGQC